MTASSVPQIPLQKFSFQHRTSAAESSGMRDTRLTGLAIGSSLPIAISHAVAVRWFNQILDLIGGQ